MRQSMRAGVISFLMMLGMVLTGCGGTAPENDSTIIVEREEEESNYMLKQVTVSDVVLSQTIRFKYKEASITEVPFPVSERRVVAVHIKEGDMVEEGQVLYELEGVEQDEEIARLEYEIARNELLLSYLEVNESYDRSEQWWNFIYKQNSSTAAQERLNKSLSSLEKSYRYKREDYEDAIRLAKKRLDEIRSEVETGTVCAPVAGMVKSLAEGLLGSISDVKETSVVIVDNSLSLFEVGGVSYADYFEEGVPIAMKLGYGRNAAEVQVVPYNKASWVNKMYFQLIQTPETPVVEEGDSGIITLEMDKREQVLAISKQVIHTADGKNYVYVLGENDIREVRWVEVGLRGNTLVEIISGLEEGESVVLR